MQSVTIGSRYAFLRLPGGPTGLWQMVHQADGCTGLGKQVTLLASWDHVPAQPGPPYDAPFL